MLLPTDQLTVAFRGIRSGRGNLTWAQEHIWDLCRQLGPDQHYFTMSRTLQLPAGRTVTDVVSAIRLLVERYEALRTTIHREPDGTPVQSVCGSGSLVLDVYELGDGTGDPAVEQILTEHRAQSFDDLAWPVRIAVLTRATEPRYVLITASHVAVDRTGLNLVCGALLRLLAGTGDGLPQATHQPLDQAAVEGSRPALRAAQRALDYWRRTLLTVPPTLLPAIAPSSQNRWSPAGDLRSEATAMAVEAIAAKHGVSPSAAVLAAVAVLLGVRAGVGAAALQLVVSNRLGGQQRDLVSTCVQLGLFAVDLRGASFHEVVARAGTAALRAYRYARYPWNRMAAILDEVNLHRGLSIDLSCNFHDSTAANRGPITASSPAEIAAAVQRSVYRRGASWDRSQRLHLRLQREQSSVWLSLSADPSCLSYPDVESVLRGIETLLVRSVYGDFELSEVPTLAGIAPLHRPAGAVEVDNYWVDLDAVRQLLADVAEVSAVRVRLDGTAAGTRQIVGHVASRRADLTPERLHRECLALLPGRTGAATPHRYVIHAAGELATWDDHGWQAAEVRFDGTGRPPFS